MSVHWHSYASPEEAAEHCARHIAGLLDEALSGESCASIALSGGNSVALLFPRLAAQPVEWSRIHLFWTDERAVPPQNPQSNYGVAERLLISACHVPRRNVHRIPTELRPEAAAARYSDEIREFFGIEAGELPHFDVIQRGMGADAHTCSLFPGDPLIDDREGIAAAVWVEKLNQWRITLLPGVLLAARHNAVFTVGAEKAAAVRAVFKEEYDPKKYPSQLVSHHGRGITWFLDDAAAKLMD